MYGSTLSLTSVLVEVGGQRHVLAALTLERDQVQGAGWASNARSGRVRRDWLSPGFDPRIVPPVVIRYSD
jgi:hypothetical protein